MQYKCSSHSNASLYGFMVDINANNENTKQNLQKFVRNTLLDTTQLNHGEVKDA